MRIFLIATLLALHLPARAITFKPPGEIAPKTTSGGASR